MQRGRIKKFCQGGGGGGGGHVNVIFSHQHISQRAVRTSLKKQLDPLGPIAFRGWSLPEFLRLPIATCDFPGQVLTPCLPPLDPPIWQNILLC